MTRCLIVQHVAPESPFAIGEALHAAGAELDVRRVFEGDPLPVDCSGADGLVVMGGPMSAASSEGFASRDTELELLADALAAGVPTLGVCLGAQLLAAAAGAAVYPGGAGPEIGWGPVELLAGRHGDRLFEGLPDRLTVLHWHGDTFDLPAGSHHLARNANYANQAFRIGEAAWGVQFHLEVTGPAVEGFLDAFAPDAARAPGGAATIRGDTPGALADLAAPRDRLFGRFADLVAARAAV